MSGAVVVGVDGSRQGMRALEWAAQAADLHHRPLVIVYALPTTEWIPGQWDAAKADGEEIIAEAAAVARECYPSLDIDSRMVTDSPAAALREESETAYLVVVGDRGRGGFHNLLLGSTSLQLAGHATCPVAVVRDGPNASHREIVVGVDGSHHADAALDYAFEEAAVRHMRLHAVHAWHMPAARDEPPVLVSPDPAEVTERERDVLTRALAERSGEHPDVEVVGDLPAEHPAHALIRASEFADLIVVGSRGRGGIHGLALGSVSHAVLHHAMCPVVIARPRP